MIGFFCADKNVKMKNRKLLRVCLVLNKILEPNKARELRRQNRQLDIKTKKLLKD